MRCSISRSTASGAGNSAAVFARLIGLVAAVLLVAACAAYPPDPQPRVLLFSHSTGFRHASIEPGIAAIEALGRREGMTVVASEDPVIFSAEGLSGFDAIILLSTTTDPKDPASEFLAGARGDALQGFVRGGGGIVAIHAAADSHHRWPWYGKMIGGRFERHPAGTPKGRLTAVDRGHPSTAGLPTSIERVDEWYYFADYNPEAKLLITLDPASIGEADVNPNPISWAHEFEGGRVFYTAMGHTDESYADPYVLDHVAGALRWAIGR